MSDYIGVDTETTGLDLFHNAAPFLISSFDDDEEYGVIDFDVDPYSRHVQVTMEGLEETAHLISGKKVVFHHAKYDLRALSVIGIELRTPTFHFTCPKSRLGQYETRIIVDVEEVHDTQILSHVVNSQGCGPNNDDYGMHGLKPLSLFYLDIPEGDERELVKAVIRARNMAKHLGWKRGTSLKGKAQPKTDYWMPGQLFSLQESGEPLGYIGKKGEFIELEIPDSWEDICATYAKGDVFRTLSLFFFLQEILHRDKLEKQYDREMRLLPVTYNMENAGMHIQPDDLTSTLGDFKKDAEGYKKEAEDLFCNLTSVKSLNVNSGDQLAAVLEKCDVKLTKLTDKGKICTDAEVLRSKAQWCESTDLKGNPRSYIQRQAGAALRLMIGYDPDEGDVDPVTGEPYEKKIPGYKTYATGMRYLRGYFQLMDTYNNVHPSFNQVGTSWTRFSSSEPNGQNVSKKAVLPLRRVFGPPPGYIWLAVDYEQLELRIFAYWSGDKGLISAFESGLDFHMSTACEMFGCSPEEVTSERRRSAKYVNFGIVYGAGPAKVDEQSGQPGTYALYMGKFPNAKAVMARTLDEVAANGFVYTLGGYRLYVRADKPYAGVNGVVQGTAGEIVKNAMVDIHERGLVDWAEPTEDLPYGGSSIVANIHDELVFQIPRSYPYRTIGRRIMNCMVDAGSALGVITPVDSKIIFSNWASGEKFK